jgi:hypothetical protein
MNDPGDMRVPVWAGDPARAEAGDAVQSLPPPGAVRHAVGCVCRAPRAPLAESLAKLFFARARGDIPFFARVIVPCPPDGEPALAAALAADPVTAARFRFAGRLAAQGGSVASPSPSDSSI